MSFKAVSSSLSSLPVIITTLTSLIITLSTICHCVEEAAPEVLLQPRNFNPHPYKSRYQLRPVPSYNLEQQYQQVLSNNVEESYQQSYERYQHQPQSQLLQQLQPQSQLLQKLQPQSQLLQQLQQLQPQQLQPQQLQPQQLQPQQLQPQQLQPQQQQQQQLLQVEQLQQYSQYNNPSGIQQYVANNNQFVAVNNNNIEINDKRNKGPVLFPRNPEDDVVVTSKPVVDRLKEIHPYAAVAKKQKIIQGGFVGGRWKNDDVRVSPLVYKALAAHGAKVLKIPTNGLDNTLSNQKKNYAFSYKVENEATGDDFSHSQSHDSDATNGEYRVKLPDGRLQIVSYTADKNGYKADVTYTEDDANNAEQQQQQQHQQQQYQRQGSPRHATLLQQSPQPGNQSPPLSPLPQHDYDNNYDNYDSYDSYDNTYYDVRQTTAAQQPHQQLPPRTIYIDNRNPYLTANSQQSLYSNTPSSILTNTPSSNSILTNTPSNSILTNANSNSHSFLNTIQPSSTPSYYNDYQEDSGDNLRDYL